MKQLAIVVPKGNANNLSSIVGAYKLFTRANEYFKKETKKEAFNVRLVGLSKKVNFYDGLFSVQPHCAITEIKKCSLIIIPSLNHNFEQARKENRELIAWIKQQHERGAEIASICTGAFLLAETGLLNGKSCSTHWAVEEIFKTNYPLIDLQTDKLITDENGIYTNGGAYSFLNLLIYLIEKYYDRATAIYCSKVFQIQMDRQRQSEFIIFAGQKMHEDEMVKKAQSHIENKLSEKISFDKLSAKLAVGRRSFDRRFIKATGNTPLEYAQRAKMEAAKKAFESSHKSISEVMFQVGYSDPKAFREVFKKITGFTPQVYKAKYNFERA